jgi:transcriptional regulator with GAF, ATPase, and Fis domain
MSLEMSNSLERRLEAADAAALERRLLEAAFERTGVRSGALFLWDPKRAGLTADFHVVEGVEVLLPHALLQPRVDGRPNGIALWVQERGEPYLCNDTARDPVYARYFLEVLSVLAVPIFHGKRVIGVLSVSSRHRDAFTPDHQGELEAIAASAARFLRRAQLDRASRERQGRPLVIKGLSPEWIDVERRLEQVAPTTVPVLLQGESGTGKELMARALHLSSRRAEGPFVTVNCAAIPEALLESLLFGHVRGAFTGAERDRKGELRRAHGGTLFLDELGELPATLQPKLLRAVELGEVQPVGSDSPPERVDVRLVCATNRDLAAAVREGRFRDDLYYRLSVFTLELPPLRRYKDQLEVLAGVFVQQAAERHDLTVPALSAGGLAALAAYDFPGNVRELKNAMEHAVVLCNGEPIGPEHLPRSMTAAVPVASPPAPASAATLKQLRETWLAPAERRYLAELLAATGGNVREAARRAGVDAVTLYRLLEKRGVGAVRRRKSAGGEPTASASGRPGPAQK